MNVLRWFRRTSVFSNLIFADTILHTLDLLVCMSELFHRMKEPLAELNLADLRFVLVAVCLQLHIVVLSTVFGIRHQEPSGLDASWWDRLYHGATVLYYYVLTVFHAMISIYEWQVEQYASCFQHLWRSVCSCAGGYLHELILTSLILRSELNLYGVSVNDIPRSAMSFNDKTDATTIGVSTDLSGTTEAGTTEMGTTEEGTTEVGTAEVGTMEADATEVGTTEVGTMEVGTTEADATGMSATEVGVTGMSATELGTSTQSSSQQISNPTSLEN